MPEKGDIFLCRFCDGDAIKVSRDFPDAMSLGESVSDLRYMNRKRVRGTDTIFACYKHRKGATGFKAHKFATKKRV